ncbi:tyrosine--tRNA ligase [bacterium]|nr:tyrosine--tRNA ligase [bacterium]
MADIYEILEQRGFIQDCTDVEAFRELTSKQSVSFYIGFDPTADSLHIGSMVPLMGMMHFQRQGHRPIAVIGGGTGMIGDPSGKSAERNLQTLDQIEENIAGQRKQFELFLDFSGKSGAKIVNNYDWLSELSFLDYLREVGKHFRIGEMLGKESVRARLNSDAGISYTEFSYMLLQAYDFRYLMEHENCCVQCGGGDQWGNITAGIELIRKTIGKPAFGLTFPLLTTATGQKFGKTEAGAVWLDKERTSSYDFFQYWVRADDRDVERYMKLFTLLDLEEIATVMIEHSSAPESRAAQKRLAFEVTRIVHGEDEAKKARDAAETLFGSSEESLAEQLSKLDNKEVQARFPDTPWLSFAATDLDEIATLRVFTEAGLVSSKKEADRLRKQGGLYLNEEPVEKVKLSSADFPHRINVLRVGKKKYGLVEVSA